MTTVDEATYLRDLAALQRAHWPAGVPSEAHHPLGEITMGEQLREWAKRQPQRTAIQFYGHATSYAELDRLTDRYAAWLQSSGVKPGDRVAVMLANCPQFHIAFFGALKYGAIHVPVNPLFKDAELIHELNDSGATVLLVMDALVDLALAVQSRTSVTRVLVTNLGELIPDEPTLPVLPSILSPKRVPDGTVDLLPALAACTHPTPPIATDLDAVAALNYTGGTTGMPKGCVHTQRDMVYTCASAITVGGGAAPDDVLLNYLPIFWIAGENMGLLFPLFTGSTVVMLARWDPLAACAAFERYRVTQSAMVLDNAVEILDHPEASRFDFSALRTMRCASFIKKLNPSYRARWKALTGTVMAEAAWGMTETHTSDTFTAGMQDDDFDLKGQPVFVGLPVPGTRIKVCDWDSGAPLPHGTPGELVVSSPSLLKGYWNRPGDDSLRDGWLHTGDIAVYDDMGYLHFLGRRKEMLKVRGMSVFPAEIEALLGQHPEVIGSGVIGRPDEAKGEVPVAFVCLRPGASSTAEALVAWCRESMAGYKVPEVHIVDALPMTATGKVKKHELAARLQP